MQKESMDAAGTPLFIESCRLLCNVGSGRMMGMIL